MADGTQPPGSGTEGDPYNVSLLDHLLWISTNSSSWASYFVQTADIDASATSTWNGGEGFSRIGYGPSFTGSYDGNWHTISNLYINRPSTSYQGFFGMANGADISNLGLVNVDITGASNVGGLIGSNANYPPIENCYVTGSITGYDRVGGLIGNNYKCVIKYCYTEGTVTGYTEVGGLIGYASYLQGIIYNYSTCNVIGEASSIGGLIGYAYTQVTIQNNYCRGNVTCNSNFGVGSFIGSNGNNGIYYCYATGSVTFLDAPDPTDRGFVGFESSSNTYSSNFWDTETSGQSTAIGATGKTTALMKTQSTFTDASWDFITIWAIDGITNDGYPFLQVTPKPNPAITWDGSTSSDWSINTNWVGDVTPTSDDNVEIPNVVNDPEIQTNGTANCNHLTIDNEATLTIKSDASGTGSFIVSGVSSGDVVFKRYVDEASKAAKWHYVSAPVAGQALNTDWMTNNSISFSDPAYQFYRWDEDTDYWIYFDYEGSAPEDFGDDTFVEAHGYALTRTGAGELSFTGTVRTSDVTYAATYTTAKGEGSNLVGNPFTSAIGVTSEATSTQNFIAQNSALLDDSHEALYIWDEAAGYNGSNQDYKVISNGAIGEHTRILQDYIQPGQAFIVEVVSGGGDLAFNENMQAHATVDFYKNTKELFPSVELIVENNEFFNSTAIGFNENMSFGLDPSYDVGKMKGNPDIALYTRLVEDNGVDFAIQALPPLNTEKIEVKVGLDVSQAGDYNFKLIESENFDETTSIKLEDKETGNLIDFREAEEYSFNISQAGQIRERFVLHFNNATGIEDQTPETENIRFYVYDNKLYIIDKELKNGTIQLFNMLGQPVIEKQYSEVVNTFDLNLSDGYYVVRIITEKASVSGKIYVE